MSKTWWYVHVGGFFIIWSSLSMVSSFICCPQKSGNAVLGIPYALASLSFCQLLNLDLLKASATLTLAELWLSFGPNHAKMASNLIQQALPLILGHGGLELRARAFIAEAKCLLSDPSFSGYLFHLMFSVRHISFKRAKWKT